MNLELYREGMARLPAHMRRTQCPRVMSQEGGFAALFALDFKGLFARGYEDPLLVSCTDGVGTKLKVAVNAGVHHTVGIDLVAMSVNDALCTGAEPLFFLDYVAMSHDDPALLEQIVRGIADACVECDCALVGGETAILPDMYHGGDYDLAGFCVGVVERTRVIDGRQIQPGDVAIGIASSGFHSNGYSLVRKAVFEMGGLQGTDRVEHLGNKTVTDVSTSLGQTFYKVAGVAVPFIRADLHLIKKKSEAAAAAAVPAEVNDERNIDMDGAKKEAPEPVKLTPEETKLVDDYKFRKMNKKEKAKFTAKKDAQAEAEKIKEELARAAENAKEELLKAEKLKKREEAKAKREARLDKLTAPAMARTMKRQGLG